MRSDEQVIRAKWGGDMLEQYDGAMGLQVSRHWVQFWLILPNIWRDALLIGKGSYERSKRSFLTSAGFRMASLHS